MMDSLEQLHALPQRGGFCRRPGCDSRHRDTRTQRLTAGTILLLALTRLCARVRWRRRVSTLHQRNAALTSAHRAAAPQPPTSLFIQARPRAAAPPPSTQRRLTSATRTPRARAASFNLRRSARKDQKSGAKKDRNQTQRDGFEPLTPRETVLILFPVAFDQFPPKLNRPGFGESNFIPIFCREEIRRCTFCSVAASMVHI